MRGFVTVCRKAEEDEDGTLLACSGPCSRRARKDHRLAQGGARSETGRGVPKMDGSQMAPSTLKCRLWNRVARQKIDPR